MLIGSAPFCRTLTTDRLTSLLVESDGYVLGELSRRDALECSVIVLGNPLSEEERRRGQEICVGLDRSLLEVVGVGLNNLCGGRSRQMSPYSLRAECAGCLRTFKWRKKWKECDRRCVR